MDANMMSALLEYEMDRLRHLFLEIPTQPDYDDRDKQLRRPKSIVVDNRNEHIGREVPTSACRN